MNSKTMHRFGFRVQAPMNCTTFLCLTFRMIETSCSRPPASEPQRNLIFIQPRAKGRSLQGWQLLHHVHPHPQLDIQLCIDEGWPQRPGCTMRFGSTAKVLAKCKLKYYRISEWDVPSMASQPVQLKALCTDFHGMQQKTPNMYVEPADAYR